MWCYKNGDRAGFYMQMVLGLAMLIPSVSNKDHTVVGTFVEIEHNLSLSWPDNLFRPQSQVPQLRPEVVLSKCTHRR
jgi:hypothetical protein